jgi:zinc protease
MRALTRFATVPLILLGAAGLQGSGQTAAPKTVQTPGTIALPEPGSPFIAFNIWIKSGSASDPKGKEGLASLTAAMVGGGATTSDTLEGILDKLYPMAAGYGVSVDKEMTNLTGRVHRDHLEGFYTLLKNAVLSPALAEADFTRIKAQRLNFVERSRRYARDEELSKQLLFSMAYEGTAYAHPEEGYVSSVRAITLDDVKAFHRTHYVRNNIVVGVGGGYPDGFPERIRKEIDTLPEGAPPAVTAPEPKMPAGMKVLIVDKQTDASAVSFGYPIDLLRNGADFVPMLVVNSYFGEHRNSVGRLYQAIRETRGMNYGNYSYIEAFPAGYATQQPRVNVPRRSQLFEVWIRPVSLTEKGNLHDRTLFATRTAIYELQKLADGKMPAAAVEESKNFLRNYVATWGTSISRRLGYAVDDRFYGLPAPGFLQSLRAAIDKVTPQQVNAAIAKHLQDDNLFLVVITADAEAFKKKLLSGEPTPITYAGQRSAELLAEDKLIASLRLNVKESDITIVPIDKVFE